MPEIDIGLPVQLRACDSNIKSTCTRSNARSRKPRQDIPYTVAGKPGLEKLLEGGVSSTCMKSKANIDEPKQAKPYEESRLSIHM
eukprot:143963-Amphidinium_carterae.1